MVHYIHVPQSVLSCSARCPPTNAYYDRRQHVDESRVAVSPTAWLVCLLWPVLRCVSIKSSLCQQEDDADSHETNIVIHTQRYTKTHMDEQTYCTGALVCQHSKRTCCDCLQLFH